MGDPVKLTAPQLTALREIDKGIRVFRNLGQNEVSGATVIELCDLGLLDYTVAVGHFVTDAGRRVLEEQ